MPIKNAKDHQFEESSKMPPFSGAFVLFCFVCICALVVVLSSCPPPSLLREREKKANFLPSRSRCIRAFARHALLIPYIALLSVVHLLYILSSSSSQQVQVNALGVSKRTMVRSSFSSPFFALFSSLLICVRERF